jgi:hypothetical protein
MKACFKERGSFEIEERRDAAWQAPKERLEARWTSASTYIQPTRQKSQKTYKGTGRERKEQNSTPSRWAFI